MALYAFALGLEKKGFHAAVWAENIQLVLSAMALGQKESASRLCAGSRPAAGTPVWAANQLDERLSLCFDSFVGNGVGVREEGLPRRALCRVQVRGQQYALPTELTKPYAVINMYV
eukprot:g2303.t1